MYESFDAVALTTMIVYINDLHHAIFSIDVVFIVVFVPKLGAKRECLPPYLYKRLIHKSTTTTMVLPKITRVSFFASIEMIFPLRLCYFASASRTSTNLSGGLIDQHDFLSVVPTCVQLLKVYCLPSIVSFVNSIYESY